MELNRKSRGASSPGEQAITIKHGNAPEIQAVNISMKKKRAGITIPGDVETYTDNVSEEPFRRRRPVSKTMTTTKSTMTNEEDYQIDVTKYIDDDNASRTTLSHQPNERDLESRPNDVIHISMGNVEPPSNETRKSLAWKVSPKVHFPLYDESPSSSPVPMESLPEFADPAPAYTKTVEWDHLQHLATIEPPYEHRPNKSYLVNESQQLQTAPLKVWPGYGGNIYFEPVLVKSKPIYQRDDQNVGARSRSRATSRYTYGETATSPDAFSDSRYLSMPPSTPIQPGTRKDTPVKQYRFVNSLFEDEVPFQRKMAHLDRDYILNMKVNPKIHEDWSWIAGLESIGTLCIGDASEPLRRPKPIPISRTVIVEKIPRNFTFHPGNNSIPGVQYRSPRPVPLVQVKIRSQKKDTNPTRRYSFKRRAVGLRSSPKFSQGRQSRSLNTSTNYPASMRRIRFPNVPVRGKGERVNEINFHNPWEMPRTNQPKSTISQRNRINHDTASMQKRSRIMKFISQSRAKATGERANSPFSVKSCSMNQDVGEVKFVHDNKLISHRPSQSIDPETDDEDRVSYETLHSAYFTNQDNMNRRSNKTNPALKTSSLHQDLK